VNSGSCEQSIEKKRKGKDKPVGVFIYPGCFSKKDKISELLQSKTRYVSMDRGELVEGMKLFESHFKEWVSLACEGLGYKLPGQDYFNCLSRFTQELKGVIGKGIKDGILIEEGWKFRLKGLSHEKGPYKWFSKFEEGCYPACNWEYFVQVAEYIRLYSLYKDRRLELNFEDKLMDITVRKENRLLICVEAKEKKQQLEGLIKGISKYFEQIDFSENDRGNDSLRKAKYIVKHRPVFFSGVAMGFRLDFRVAYFEEDKFQFIPVSLSESGIEEDREVLYEISKDQFVYQALEETLTANLIGDKHSTLTTFEKFYYIVKRKESNEIVNREFFKSEDSLLTEFQKRYDPECKILHLKCSICNVPLEPFLGRYPNSVCRECDSRAVNSEGKVPYFDSLHDMGDNPIFIDGKKCWRRYRFGGYITVRCVDCPECKSGEVIPFLYGLPGKNSGIMKEREEGKIALGGCIIYRNSPIWHCKKCGYSW